MAATSISTAHRHPISPLIAELLALGVLRLSQDGSAVVNPNGAVLQYHIQVTISPAAVAANTTAEQLFTVPGVAVGDGIVVNKPSAQAGLGIVGMRVSAANQIGITFSNNTAGALTPAAGETYQILGVR